MSDDGSDGGSLGTSEMATDEEYYGAYETAHQNPAPGWLHDFGAAGQDGARAALAGKAVTDKPKAAKSVDTRSVDLAAKRRCDGQSPGGYEEGSHVHEDFNRREKGSFGLCLRIS